MATNSINIPPGWELETPVKHKLNIPEGWELEKPGMPPPMTTRGLGKNIISNLVEMGKATPSGIGYQKYLETKSPWVGLKTTVKESLRPLPNPVIKNPMDVMSPVIPIGTSSIVPTPGESLETGKFITSLVRHPLKTPYEKPVPTIMTLGMLTGAAKPILGKFGTLKGIELDNFINHSINKAIRPTVVGKGTFEQIGKYNKNAVNAVKSIVEHKNDLTFTDEIGQPVKKLPESISEFSQAIQDTKSSIYKKYNALQQQATGQGVQIDLKPLANEINLSANQEGMSLFPDVQKYGNIVSQRLSNLGNITPEAAENIIKSYNLKLKAFYKNPTPGTAQKVVVDAMVANRLRNILDETIEKSVAPGYQDLKTKYGALRSLENDVNRRLIVDARKNVKGFFDLTDIFSAGDIMKGLLTMNPAEMAKGAVQSGIKAWFKHINSPDIIIKNMFSKLETKPKFFDWSKLKSQTENIKPGEKWTSQLIKPFKSERGAIDLSPNKNINTKDLTDRMNILRTKLTALEEQQRPRNYMEDKLALESLINDIDEYLNKNKLK